MSPLSHGRLQFLGARLYHERSAAFQIHFAFVVKRSWWLGDYVCTFFPFSVPALS